MRILFFRIIYPFAIIYQVAKEVYYEKYGFVALLIIAIFSPLIVFFKYFQSVFYYFYYLKYTRLKKDICKKCLDKYRPQSWQHMGEIQWSFGLCDGCPVKPYDKDVDISHDPPENCHYALEHLMEFQDEKK